MTDGSVSVKKSRYRSCSKCVNISLRVEEVKNNNKLRSANGKRVNMSKK
jgi:hypothetical protein